MATKIENDKGFKVLSLSSREARKAGMGTLDGCICMHCNDIIKNRILYVAVLNDCMCLHCFKQWYKGATRYPEDNRVEEKNFRYYEQKFKEVSETSSI